MKDKDIPSPYCKKCGAFRCDGSGCKIRSERLDPNEKKLRLRIEAGTIGQHTKIWDIDDGKRITNFTQAHCHVTGDGFVKIELHLTLRDGCEFHAVGDK